MSRDFSPKEFAQNLADQAKDLVPDDLSSEHKENLIETLYTNTLLTAEALIEREHCCYNDNETCELISQIIAEWTFHKYVDLCRAGIPDEFFQSILQKIGYEIYEYVTEATEKGVDTSIILSNTESLVQKTYKKALLELKKSKKISSKIAERGLFISNIDKMCTEKLEQEAIEEREKKKRAFWGFIEEFEFFVTLYSLLMGVYTFVFYGYDVLIFKAFCILFVVSIISLAEKLINGKKS